MARCFYVSSRIIIGAILLAHATMASGQQLRFEQVLGDLPVFCIAMDQDHVMWFGTESGLFSYNSKQLTNYRFDPRDSLSLLDNSIRSILIDSKNQLWIGTRNGLNRYRPLHDNFDRYVPNPYAPDQLHGGFITSLAEDPDGYIWVGTEAEGLHRLNPVSGAIVHIKADSTDNTLISNNIEKIRIDKEGGLWVASRHGLNFRERTINQWHHYYASPNQRGSLPGNDLIGLEIDHAGNTWVSDRHKNISMINALDETRVWTSEDVITVMTTNDNGDLLLGTYTGQIISIPAGHSSWEAKKHIRHDQQELGTIRTIFQDQWGNLWVGSENGLFVHYNTERQFIAHHGNTSLLPFQSVMAMMMDNADRLLLSSGSQMVTLKKIQYGDFRMIRHDYLPNIHNVYAFYQDKSGMIWMGTIDNGLFGYDPADHTMVHFTHDPENPLGIGHNSIWAIAEDSDNNLWLGSWGGGLIYFNRHEGTFKTFEADHFNRNSLNHPKILSLLFDQDGLLWIGTDGGGLSSYDPQRNAFTRYEVRSDNRSTTLDRSILSIKEDREGRIWMGSDGGGLFMYDKTNFSFSVYNEAHGLQNLSVKHIIEDETGHLWLSTNGGGIFLFRPDEERFIQFTTIDGISTNRFHNKCGLVDAAGNIYFGGFSGFTVFHPEKIQITNYNASILLTNVTIDNEDRSYGEDGLLHMINREGELRLKPVNRLISIEFAAIEYALANRNTYRYRLKGFNDSWTDLGNDSRVSFMNLPPGRYEFELQTSNSDGLWSENTISFALHVLPPFHKTPVFFISLALVITLSIYGLFWYNIRGLRKRQLLLEEAVSQRTQKIRNQSQALVQQNKALIKQKQELTSRNRKIIKSRERIRLMTKKIHEADQTKLRFFTNISHELRTPLTLIIGPLEQLIEKFMYSQDNTLDQLLTMRKNAGRILKLFDQIITFRKAESGSLRLTTALGDISCFIKNLVSTYKDFADHKHIDILLESHPTKIFIHFDEEKVEKIFTNLLSNALKFTPAGGRVQISLRELPKAKTDTEENKFPEGAVEINIADTGIGIPQSELSNIFNRFYQVNQKEKQLSGEGVGIGLALVKSLVVVHQGEIRVDSKEGEGSVFSLLLPRGTAHLPTTRRSRTAPVRSKKDMMSRVAGDGCVPDMTNELQISATKPSMAQKPCESKNKPSVLIIEDNHDLRHFLSKWLQKEYRVLEAENGLKGLETARKEHPDIVISDVVMPEMDGLDFLKQLKSDVEFCHIPVILLSAKADIADRIAGLKLYADAYIAKPFHLDHLSANLKTLLENRKIIQNKYRDVFFLEPEEIKVLSPDEIFLKKAKAIIEENIPNPDFDVNQLSRDVGVSRAGVYRKMKALTNMSVSILIRNMRMKRAAQILAQNKVNVSEVAYMVGFNDVQYFRKCFQKMYKMPPSQYAEKHAH